MTNPAASLDALLAGVEDPAEVLLTLLQASSEKGVSLEQVAKAMSSPALARAATPESCEQLVHFLRDLANQSAEAGVLVAQIIERRASTLDDIGRSSLALPLYEEVVSVMEGSGMPDRTATCRMHRAIVLYNMGRYAEAVAGYDEALPLFRQHGLPADVAGCQMNRASTLQRLGRYAEAVAGYDEALPLFRQHGLPASVARCQMNRASTLQSLGRYAEAVAGYDEALPLFRQHGLPADVASCQMNRASTLQSLGRYAEAVAGYDEALPLFRQHGLPADVASCQMNRASTLDSLGRYAEAVAGYDEALPLFRQHGLPADVARCEMHRASGLACLDRYAEAVAGYEELEIEELHGDVLRSYHENFADALWQTGERGRALEHSARARECLRQARRLAGIDETSLEFVAERRGFLHKTIKRLLELDRHQDAFTAIQDGKGSVLGDLRQRLGKRVHEEPPSISGTRKTLVDCLRLPSATAAERSAWPAELKRRTADYLREWGQHHHAYQADWEESIAADGPAALEQIQAALPADWAVIDFWRTGNEEVTAFVVFRDGLHVKKLLFPIESKKSFHAKLDRLVESIRDPAAPPNDEALDDLHAYLFAPLRPLLRDRAIRGLYLVPHGYLHALPLHACRWREQGQNVYLCERYAVAYLPSAALLPQLPSLRLNGRVLSLSNPERGTPHTLPCSDWEGRQLHDRLGAPAGAFHLGPDATSEQTQNWEDAGLLHFSCHGLGDTQFAPRSHLRLADDLLMAHDVAYRRPPLHDGSLVLLNGCQTGVRDWRAVDEGMGLMTAFLLRGASLVMATQWSVVDLCAAEVVLDFVDAVVHRKIAPTQALLAAQNRIRRLTPDEILARCDEVKELFPPDEFPHEAGRFLIQKAWVCRRAGRDAEAHACAEEAAAPLRRAGLGIEADRLLEATRAGAGGLAPRTYRVTGFDHPIFWAAFHFVGRVT